MKSHFKENPKFFNPEENQEVQKSACPQHKRAGLWPLFLLCAVLSHVPWVIPATLPKPSWPQRIIHQINTAGHCQKILFKWLKVSLCMQFNCPLSKMQLGDTEELEPHGSSVSIYELLPLCSLRAQFSDKCQSEKQSHGMKMS